MAQRLGGITVKSAFDLCNQATILIEDIAVRAYEKANREENWNTNPIVIARIENVKNILDRYVGNITKACGQSYPLSNANFNKPFPREIYADTH